MATVVLLRHGQTEWNRASRLQGWAASSLTDQGRKQAQASGRHLADTYALDRIVASDLRRTRETTVSLCEQGQFPEPEYTRGWRERCFGDLQGLTATDVFQTFPEYNAENGVMALESRPPRGESLLDTRRRVLDAWDRLLETTAPNDEVLVVTHGGPIYILLAHLGNTDLLSALDEYHHDNCGLTELRHEHTADGTTDSISVIRQNECDHFD